LDTNLLASYQLHTPADRVDFYVAVTAVDYGGNASVLDDAGGSFAGPVQSVSNVIRPGLDAVISAGFDPLTSVLIPAGAVSDWETIDILWPEESVEEIEEADQFLEKAHIDYEVDFHFADTIREFRARASRARRPDLTYSEPIRVTLSYADVTEFAGMDPNVRPLSQDDELSFRIFRLNDMARIPRWELVPGPQEVDQLQNTVSVFLSPISIFRETDFQSRCVLRIARLKLPENLDKVVVYPNPFIPSQAISGYITFKNLTENFTIQLYDMAGRHIRTIPDEVGGGDQAMWDVRNSAGDEVASGTYVFVIQSDEDTYMGKIIILR
jgi:hypothetical protein